MVKKNKSVYVLFLIGCVIAVCFFLGACQYRPDCPLKLSGHRGARLIAPENTLASVDSCVKYGVDLIECDVCISKDSVFYLLHDSTLDRTTNGTGDISDWLSQDIDTLDAGSWFGEGFRGICVPRLADVLRRVKQNGLGLTIDYRTGDFGRLLDLVRSEGMLDNCTFVFASEEKFKEFQAFAPEVKTLQAYIRSNADFERVVSSLKPDIAVMPLDSLTSDLVSRSRLAGIKMMALALNSDTPDEDYGKAIHLGVDILATDYPVYLAKKYMQK